MVGGVGLDHLDRHPEGPGRRRAAAAPPRAAVPAPSPPPRRRPRARACRRAARAASASGRRAAASTPSPLAGPSASTRRSRPRGAASSVPSRSGSATTASMPALCDRRAALGGRDWCRAPRARPRASAAPSARPRQPQPTISTRATSGADVAPAGPRSRRSARTAPCASARPPRTSARIASSVISGAPARAAALVLRLDHLVHVVELELAPPARASAWASSRPARRPTPGTTCRSRGRSAPPPRAHRTRRAPNSSIDGV